MKHNSDKQLALNLLAHKSKGYSILYVFKKSKYRYLVIFLILALLTIAFFETQNLILLLIVAMFVGALIRDIGWLRRIKGTWSFNEKVIDWNKVEELAEKEK